MRKGFAKPQIIGFPPGRGGPGGVGARRLPARLKRIALYEGGWHLLYRDLQAEIVHRDVAAWIADRNAPLPSGADARDAARSLAGRGAE